MSSLSFAPAASGNTETHDVLPESSFSSWIDSETAGERITARPAVASQARVASEPAPIVAESSTLYDDMQHQWHAIASDWPMLSDVEIRDMADSIKSEGLHHEIILFEGKVLDGRNRLAACRLAGITPTFIDFEGTYDEADARVTAENSLRRHMTSQQRAAAAAKRDARRKRNGQSVKEELQAQAEERKTETQFGTESSKKPMKHGDGKNSVTDRRSNAVREKRASAAGTNPKYIDMADKVEAARPDLTVKVINGEMSLPEAHREVVATSADNQAARNDAETDLLGKRIPAHLKDVFDQRGLFNEARSHIKKARSITKSLSEGPAGGRLSSTIVTVDISNVHRQILSATPYTACPYKDGANHEGCNACKGLGWLTADQYDRIVNSSVAYTGGLPPEFDDKKVERAIEQLSHVFRDRANSMRCHNCPEHLRANELMGLLQENFEAWKKRISA